MLVPVKKRVVWEGVAIVQRGVGILRSSHPTRLNDYNIVGCNSKIKKKKCKLNLCVLDLFLNVMGGGGRNARSPNLDFRP